VLAGSLAAKLRFDMDVRVTAQTDVVALLASNWTMRGAGADGNPLQLSGTTADVVRRQADGSWLAAIDCPNGA
jgi:ketosteroid isomerase-like protein